MSIAHIWRASRQAKRVETLVVMLTALLRRWVEGDEQGFKVPAHNRAWPAYMSVTVKTVLASCGGWKSSCKHWMRATQPSSRC